MNLEKESKFLETGLSKEYREKINERDPIQEVQEDVELYQFIIDSLNKRIKDVLIRTKEIQLSEKDYEIIDKIKFSLEKVRVSLAEILEQGELFETIPDNKGKEKAVKLLDLASVKEEVGNLFVIMSGIDNLGHKVTPSFKKNQEFSDALFKKQKQFYDRYFSDKIAEKERDLSQLTGVDVALFNSGMSAITTILENEKLKKGDTIVTGKNFYSQTKEILDDYDDKGIKVIQVDTGQTKEVIKEIEDNNPKFLMLETIANAPSMEAADIEALMQKSKDYNEKNPQNPMRLIVDNSFLTPQLLNIPEKAKKFWSSGASPVVVVESATKYYQWGLDNINCGIVYTDNKEYLEKLKKERGKIGTNLQGKLASFLPDLSPELAERKMFRHSDNALFLVKTLEKFSDKFQVSYPGLESHRDYQTFKKEAKGAGGIIYLILKEGIDGEKLVDQIKEEAEKEGVPVNIGGSFGHPETWLVGINRGTEKEPNWFIRIAVGSENIGDFQKVKDIFEKIINKF